VRGGRGGLLPQGYATLVCVCGELSHLGEATEIAPALWGGGTSAFGGGVLRVRLWV
jgi:hypothetical protein